MSSKHVPSTCVRETETEIQTSQWETLVMMTAGASMSPKKGHLEAWEGGVKMERNGVKMVGKTQLS